MKMKKILAMLLSAVLCVSSLSFAAFADEAEEAAEVIIEEVAEEVAEEAAEIEEAEEAAEEAVAELAAEEEKEEAPIELSAEGDSEQEPQENYVAKVGNTSYTSIDDAIANWANNATLTLLDNVTLSDVIMLSSTEMHTLDLGTYTMTAASGKDAIQIVNNGRSSASYALDIKADSENPGGITATGKAIVRTDGKSGVKDRPIIRFYGGVFNASYIVYHTGSNGTNCPQFQFHGGEFNGTIYTNRTLNQFHGGTFNGSLMMSVDTSAYALINGGTFKQLSNLFMSALNSDKFTIGSAKGNYNREVYINKDGYYVVAATLPEGSIEAAVSKNTTTNDYLKYSKVGTEGVLKYEEADDVLESTGSGTIYLYASSDADMTVSGTLTLVLDSGVATYSADAAEGVVYSGNVKLNSAKAKFVLDADANSDFSGKVAPYTGNVLLCETDSETGAKIFSSMIEEDANEEAAAKIVRADETIYYKTLADAVNAAVDGDTIIVIADEIAGTGTSVTIKNDITLDLGGNTFTDAYIIVTGEVEITNGYIVNVNESYPLVVQNGGELTLAEVDVNASKSDRAVWVRSGSTLNINEGADILATKGENNTKTSLIAGVYTDTNTTVNVNGGTITVDTPDNKAVGIYGNYAGADVNMTAGKISTSGKGYNYGINVDGDITISDGEIVTNEKKYTTGNTKGITNGNNYALVTALGDVTVTGGKITTNGYSGYMVNVGKSYDSNDQTVTISDVEFRNNLSEIDKTVGGHKAPVLVWEGSASTVTASITGGDFYGVSENLLRGDNTDLSISGGIFENEPAQEYLSDSYAAVKLADGRFAVLAGDYSPEMIEVKFEHVSETEEEIIYNINLEAQGQVINRLNSADLTFVLNQVGEVGKNKYEIIDIEGDNIAVNPVGDNGRYEFHFTTKTNVENDTAQSITIAQVKFTGYGTFSFAIDTAADSTNAAHATTIVNNIVDSFIPGGTGEYGELRYGAAIEDTITVPTRTLAISVTFPNAVENKASDYQQMTVKISGEDLEKPVVIELGDGCVVSDLDIYTDRTDAGVEAEFTAEGAYELEISKLLIKGNKYNVEVSGEGYRTAYHTVTMTETKLLAFWNNVKDAGKAVEYVYGDEGELVEKSAKINTTFLAGDIVNDGNINIYDLSAVVSYFGELNLVDDNKYEYAKYDLNRDGLIDSKDVAYVLVSWNN